MKARRPAGLDTVGKLHPGETGHELVGWQGCKGPEALHHGFLLRRSVVSRPRRLEQRQTEQPRAVLGGEGERARATARIADEVESVEPVSVRCTFDPGDLDVERVVRRRPILRVELEILGDRVHALAEHPQQRFVGRADGQDPTR